MQITAKTTPRDIISLFIFSKIPKTTKSRMAPRVINLLNFPSDFILWIPDIKSKSVKKAIKRKMPKKQAINQKETTYLVDAYNGIGTTYIFLKQFDKAEKYLLKNL